MCKKLFFAAVIAAVGLVVLGNTRVGSYGGTAFKKIKQATQGQVPIEFEIERLQHELTQLVPDMKRNLNAVAEEIVQVQNLKDDLDKSRTALGEQKNRVFAMKESLKKGDQKISLGDRVYSAGRVRDMLSLSVASCQRLEKEVESKERLLEAKESGLDATREQLANLRAQKQELEIQIAHLQADIKTLRVTQTKSKVQIDDSRLAHIKQSLAELRNRLKVEKTSLELHNQFSDELTGGEPKVKTTEQVIKEAEAYLGDVREDGKVASDRR